MQVPVKMAILAWLTGEELAILCSVSRSWRCLACDESLWRVLLKTGLAKWDRVSSDRDPAAYRSAFPKAPSKLM